ncbi:MAG: glycosyltransferase, partial [Paludibacteraceae bacterium]|nr:glycosyltransferase [Paludibacteraceae bacterium]MBR6492804.1 glycosyltransferase [Paludibacteraceae bacterium]
MKGISLPVSKSIAQRLLMLQAINGDELMPVAVDMPDDVRVLHDALESLREYGHRPIYTSQQPLRINLGNNGTALRFLQVHLQVYYPGEPIVLEGSPRLMERDGKPTSQTTSAWLLHGLDKEGDSPYIEMTRRVIADYPNVRLERDWSAAAFWYEYIAIHGGELLLEGLTDESIQGDRVVADIYAKFFGVETKFTSKGAVVKSKDRFADRIQNTDRIRIDFTNFLDLYPAVALTCERLGIELMATGTERLQYKESDRLEAVRLHEVRNDHRIAMALMCADYPVSIEDQVCIAKSYPGFAPQHIIPIRGINDDHLGKKHALSKLIHAASSEYVWLHDDDVELPKAATICDLSFVTGDFDLIILPLKMESESAKPSLLEKLQMAEYAAIQELTMRMAKKDQAVMCSGANLIVKREVWLACEAELHPEIPSGDDMFLLEAMKRKGYRIGAIDEEYYTAIVRPKTSWKAFGLQRMRWAGKAPKYTDRDIRRCGAWIVAVNILQLLCPLIILIKFPIEYGLIRRREALYTIHHTP